MSEKKENKALEKLKTIWSWAYKLRSIILAIPVAAGAVVIAIHNYTKLPDAVGINIQTSGAYAEMVSKNVAVLGPVAITAVCLLMVFCSRKVLYPWLISVFSLVLPILIYITNTFPG